MEPVKLVDQVEVCRVRVEGLKRTKNDIVVEQVKELLGQRSLNEMLDVSLKCLHQLHSMNVFKEVEILYDVSRDQGCVVKGVEVVYQVKEAGMINSSLSAHAGAQTSDASIHFTLRNLFGRAEQLRTYSSAAFPNWGTNTGLEYIKPHYADLKKKLLLSLNDSNYGQPACGYHLHGIGPKLELQFPSLFGSHSVSYGFEWRHLHGFDNGVPMEVRLHAGHTLKGSIKHVLEMDQRDDPLAPCSGYRSKMTHEVAGVGGDLTFGKAEFQSEVYQRLTDSLVGGVSIWCGLLKTFRSNSNISDRFLLGGPTTLRGFDMWGAGPRARGYSLGGDAYWGMGTHLYHPLPYFSRTGFFSRIRLHAFGTFGCLLSTIDTFSNIIKETRASCGIGLQARLGVAVIELNYATPLRALPNDSLKPGLQFGIGMDML